MKISRNNYEVFFIDHLEGSLPSDVEKDLFAFLLLNPDLADELEGLRLSPLSSESVDREIFPNKSSLKKADLPISQEQLDELLLKAIEGSIDASETAQLEQLVLQFPFISASRKILEQTILHPENITFEDKKAIRFPESLDYNDDQIKLIAFIEGDLSPDQAAMMRGRIAAEPILNAQFKLYSSIHLVAEPFSFEFKNETKFPDAIDMSHVNHLLIAKVEGDLDTTQNNHLNDLLASDHNLRNELLLFYRTKLKPLSISFEHKTSLRKKEAVVISLRSVFLSLSSAAAVIALILWINYTGSSSTAELALAPQQNIQSIQSNAANIANDLHHTQIFDDNKTKGDDEKLSLPKKAKDILTAHFSDTVAPSKLHFLIPNRIKSVPASNFASNHVASIVDNAPDMKLVHQIAPQSVAIAPDKSMTLLSYISQTAAEKLENTFAYSFAEKQLEKITSKTKDDVKIERIEGKESDKLRLKIGSFELKTDARKRQQEPKEIIGRIERLYQSIRKK